MVDIFPAVGVNLSDDFVHVVAPIDEDVAVFQSVTVLEVEEGLVGVHFSFPEESGFLLVNRPSADYHPESDFLNVDLHESGVFLFPFLAVVELSFEIWIGAGFELWDFWLLDPELGEAFHDELLARFFVAVLPSIFRK